MKKVKIILLLIGLLFLNGCSIKSNNLENAKIYTTIYPVKYITEYLYEDASSIESIYPVGVKLEEYELTSKQIDIYSNSDLFVYIGLGKEKEIAKSLLNKNKNLLIIDATYGLSSDNITDLWLAPNNFLMLAKNIKTSLNEYLNNTVKEDAVNKKYDELYEKVSWIDAELRNMARDASENDNNTLVVASNAFKYLKGYGFNVVSIEDIESSGSEKAVADIKNKFKNSTYTSIIRLSSSEDSKLVTELKNNYKAKLVDINDLITNKDTASDYITIQYENLAAIRELVLK